MAKPRVVKIHRPADDATVKTVSGPDPFRQSVTLSGVGIGIAACIMFGRVPAHFADGFMVSENFTVTVDRDMIGDAIEQTLFFLGGGTGADFSVVEILGV